jgi:DNA replication and repair protein RecF
MILKKLIYQGFRNLSDKELDFTEDFNFVIGNNGAGKTNLLEAIFYVGLASSFRVKEEKNLIRTDEQFLRIDAQTDDNRAVIYLDNSKKKLMLQGNEVHRLSNYIGWLGITILSIEDIWIIHGVPARRRGYLDWVIIKISPSYLSNMIEYRKILRQRNKVLQSAHENGNPALLDVFDEQLIKYANEIYRERRRILPELKKYITVTGSELGLKKLDITYQSNCPNMELTQDILGKLREKELIFGYTLAGPHRDDLLFWIDGHLLKNYASEGEERTAAISSKMAEAEIYYNKTGKRPILLLDEVAAELDEVKRETLLKLLKGQIFYASTQLPQYVHIQQKRHRIFLVKRGIIEVSAKN